MEKDGREEAMDRDRAVLGEGSMGLWLLEQLFLSLPSFSRSLYISPLDAMSYH